MHQRVALGEPSLPLLSQDHFPFGIFEFGCTRLACKGDHYHATGIYGCMLADAVAFPDWLHGFSLTKKYPKVLPRRSETLLQLSEIRRQPHHT